jgi:hypothetical protein
MALRFKKLWLTGVRSIARDRPLRQKRKLEAREQLIFVEREQENDACDNAKPRHRHRETFNHVAIR